MLIVLVRCAFLVIVFTASYSNSVFDIPYELRDDSNAIPVAALGLGISLLLVFIAYLDTKDEMYKLKSWFTFVLFAMLIGFSCNVLGFATGVTEVMTAVAGAMSFLGLSVLDAGEIISEQEKEAH